MLIFLDESRDKINAFERVIAQPVRISDFIEKNLAFQEIAYTIFLPYLMIPKKLNSKKLGKIINTQTRKVIWKGLLTDLAYIVLGWLNNEGLENL